MERLGVDTGGTFTDFVRQDESGRLTIHKQLSTPDDPSLAVLDGMSTLGLAAHAAVVHGSTVATNALLERRGARTALITTAGFADVLAIGRQNRPDLYALVPTRPEPLIPDKWRWEVTERATAQGDVQQALDVHSLEPLLARIAAEQIEAVAVCFLFSYLYPKHERLVRQHIRAAFGDQVHISLSSDILPEYREYERTATTAINATVAPLMGRYLRRLADGIGARPLSIMQSNGGVIDALVAAEQAARTVLSGPAGGVVGAQTIAAQAGMSDIITFDMGGTSTDVSLCPGQLPMTSAGEIGGYPLRLPIIDIHTVGAGGGSLARVDAGGALLVGPQSAGADPGPACYGRLGPSPEPVFHVTTTDANLLLGRLDAAQFLGGEMALDLAAAELHLARMARQADFATTVAAAAAVIELANATMERAIRRISVERGYDPRRFALVAFGGAGPLHACELAQRLQIPVVLIPPLPGVLSALGMLAAAPQRSYSRTILVAADDSSAVGRVAEAFEAMQDEGRRAMVAEGHGLDKLKFDRLVDARYVGQSHELTIPIGPELASRFNEAHEQRYGFQRPDERVELVTLRLSVTADSPPLRLPEQPLDGAGSEPPASGEKLVWFAGEMHTTVLYQRAHLQAGHIFAGPAVVFQYDTTTVVPPGWTALIDGYRNLILTASKAIG